MRTLALFVAFLVAGCQHPSACEELAQISPQGMVLATDEGRCSAILSFAYTTQDRYGMDFDTWIRTVAAQRTLFVLQSVYSMTNRTTWTPSSFPREPSAIPCGSGVPVTDSYWDTAVLSRILPERPPSLYASLSITIAPNNIATINVFQDFNCDGKVGVTELTGEFKQGVSPFLGGWRLISSTTPHLEE